MITSCKGGGIECERQEDKQHVLHGVGPSFYQEYIMMRAFGAVLGAAGRCLHLQRRVRHNLQPQNESNEREREGYGVDSIDDKNCQGTSVVETQSDIRVECADLPIVVR